MTVRAQPYRLDPPVTEATLPQLVTSADEMFQILFEDLAAVDVAVAALTTTVSTVPGVRGPAGIGLPGEDGADGAQGPPGPQGITGLNGDPGTPGGPIGPPGMPGEDGVDGMDGVSGIPGQPGATGTTGATGPAGAGLIIPGEDGEDGTDGFPGAPGAAGVAGFTWSANVVKSADQTVTNSTTLVSDTELKITVGAGEFWRIEMLLRYSGNNASGDYKLGFNFPTGTNGTTQFSTIDNVLTPQTITAAVVNGTWSQGTPGSISLGSDAAAGDVPLGAHGVMVLYFPNAGDVQLTFANNTAGIGRTSTTRAGAVLRGEKLS